MSVLTPPSISAGPQPLTCEPTDDRPEGRNLKRELNNLAMRFAGGLAAGLRYLGDVPGGEFGIITYHRICPHFDSLPAPWHNVEPDRFRHQLEGLLASGHTFLPLQEVIKRHGDREKLPARTVVVTFDDGFQSVYRWAWPVLQELNIPSTIFLNTLYLDRSEPFPFDGWGLSYSDAVEADAFRPLTSDQCREMAATGLVELAAHTHTHADYRGQAPALREDLKICLDELQNRFSVEGPTFAFPYGSEHLGYADSDMMGIVQELGISCGLTTAARRVAANESPFGWGRFNVFPWDSPATLAGKLAGWYTWAPRAKQLLLG